MAEKKLRRRELAGHHRARRLPRWSVVTAGYLLVVIFLLMDLQEGVQLSFTALYLIPVAVLTWYAGRWHGFAGAVLSGGCWTVSQMGMPMNYSHPGTLFADGILILALYITFGQLLARVREASDMEQKFSRTDSLTGIANSRAFFELADHEIKRARRYKHPLTILYMDLDNFHEINNTRGLKEANTLLFTVAYNLNKNIREVDTLARIGGDEFALLLPNTPAESARVVYERIMDNIRRIMKENQWPVTMSIGVATFDEPPVDADELVRAGDRLMQQAKDRGGDQVATDTSDNPPDDKKPDEQKSHREGDE